MRQGREEQRRLVLLRLGPGLLLRPLDHVVSVVRVGPGLHCDLLGL